VERDCTHHGTNTGRKNHDGDQVEKFQFIYAHFVQGSDADNTRSDRCEEGGPSPVRFRMGTNEAGAYGNRFLERYHGAVKSRLVDCRQGRRI